MVGSNQMYLKDSLKFSTAAAGLNAATFDVSNINPDDVIKLKDKVEILPVGKKNENN